MRRGAVDGGTAAECGAGARSSPPIQSALPSRSIGHTMAKAKSASTKRKAEEPRAEPQAAQPPEERQVRRRVAAEKEALGPIHHASHGQVRPACRQRWEAPSPAAPRLPCPPASPRRRGALNPIGGRPPLPPQVAGEVFVFGDGDCGQLGLGEEVTERLRPFPVSVAGKKVGRAARRGRQSVQAGRRPEMPHRRTWVLARLARRSNRRPRAPRPARRCKSRVEACTRWR